MINNITANDKYVKSIRLFAQLDTSEEPPYDPAPLYYDEECTKPAYASDIDVIMAYGKLAFPEFGITGMRPTSYYSVSTGEVAVCFMEGADGGMYLTFLLPEDPEDYVHSTRRDILWEKSEDVYTKVMPAYCDLDAEPPVVYWDEAMTRPIYNSEVTDLVAYGVIHAVGTEDGWGKDADIFSGVNYYAEVNKYVGTMVAIDAYYNVSETDSVYLTPDPDVLDPTIDDVEYAFVRMGSEPTHDFGPDGDAEVYFLNTYHADWGGQVSETTSEEVMRACNTARFGLGIAAVFDEEHNFLFMISSDDQIGSEGYASGVVCFKDNDGVLYVPWSPDLWADKTPMLQNQYGLRYAPFNSDDPLISWAGGVLTAKQGRFVYDVYHNHSTHDGHLYFEDGERSPESLYDGKFKDVWGQIYVECSDGTKVITYN